MSIKYNDQTGMFYEVPDDPQIINFTIVGPSTRYLNESITFKWVVTDALHVFINDVEIPAGIESYQMTLTNSGLCDFILRIENADIQKSATVQIHVLEVPSFNVEKNHDKLRKGKGECFTLRWNVSNAQSLKLISPVIEDIPLSSERSFAPVESENYIFEAVGLDGERVFRHVEHIDVLEESVVSFCVDKEITLPHVPIRLSWGVYNASRVELVGYGVVSNIDEKIIDCVRETIFTLRVTDAFGTHDYIQTVSMYPPPRIQSIFVPIPQIERMIKVETHFERIHLVVGFCPNVEIIRSYSRRGDSMFISKVHSHLYQKQYKWRPTIETCRKLVKQVSSSQTILRSRSLQSAEYFIHSLRDKENNILQKIKDRMSSS